MKRSTLIVGLILAVLIVDQVIKVWVKTHMLYGEMIPILGWDRALIHFVENDGMAFGKRFNIPHGKLILSLFRIVAATLLVFFLQSLLRDEKTPRGVLISFALILAGAVGNIIDSAFYGVLFSDSYPHGLPAVFMPQEGGYSSFLHGKVVDMFYFPLFDGTWPDWLPLLGGEPFVFFGPVFNLADVAISVGVLQILFFHRKYFQQKPDTPSPEGQLATEPSVIENPSTDQPEADQPTTAPPAP
ncbi:MAG: lipoprotein signal peptidase [Bacteroidota bacterium]